MASFLPPVVAMLTANTAEFSAKMIGAKGELAGVVDSTSKLGIVGKAGLAGLAAAAGTVGVAAIHMGTEFTTQLTRLYTAAGAPKQAVLSNANAILSIGTSVGQTGTAMAEALYHPISAGLDMATALQVVKYAAQETAISGASLDDTTYSLSSVMKAFNQPASQAGQTMADLNAIVGQGDMRFQDFNESVKNWAPTAAQMGIGINSMGAGLAYLTDRGNSAEVAATRMTMGISMMTTPSKQAATLLQGLGVASSDVTASSTAMEDVLHKTGITQNKLAGDLKQPDGLYVALKDLQDGLKKAGVSGSEADSVLAKIFGGGRSDKAIMSLMQNLDGLKSKFDDISKSSTTQQFQQNWTDVQKTFGFQMQQMKAAAENVLTHLGTVLLPKLGGFIADMGSKGKAAVKEFMAGFSGGDTSTSIGKLGAFIRPVVTDIGDAAKDIVKSIGNIMGAVGPLVKVLGGGFLLGVRAAGDALGHVFGPALVAVTGFLNKNKEIVFVLGGAYLTYKGIMLGIQIATKAWAAIQGVLNAVMDANPIGLIIALVAGLALGVVELVKHWSSVVGFFRDILHALLKVFDDVVDGVGQRVEAVVKFFVVTLPQKITSGISDLASGIRSGWDRIVSDVENSLGNMIGKVGGFFTNTLPNAVRNAISWVGDIGKNIVEGIWHGIESMGQWIWNQIVNWAKSFIPGPILSALGISSPSKVMRDEVGRWIPAGIAEGITGNAGVVGTAVASLRQKMLGAAGNVAAQASLSISGQSLVPSMAGALSSSGGGQTVVFAPQVTVQGSVLSARKLLDVLREQYTQLGGRMSGTYQPYTR